MIWFWIGLIIIFTFTGVVFIGSPYVPSKRKCLRQAFHDLYSLNSDDVLVDIGSGDGVVLREAAKYGARAIGYEINPILVLLSRILSRRYKSVNVKQANFWSSPLPDETTVVYIFSVKRDMNNIKKRLQSETNRLGRPICLISFGSKFEGLKPIKNNRSHYKYLLNPLQPQKAQV